MVDNGEWLLWYYDSDNGLYGGVRLVVVRIVVKGE